MKNKALKVVLAVLVLIVLVIAVSVVSVFRMTSGLVDSADQFFLAVQEKDYSKAYSQLAEDFRASTDFQQFESFLQSTALVNYKSASWTSRSISGGTGELEGSVKTQDGGEVPIGVKLVKEKDDWKILSLVKEPAGLLGGEDRPSAFQGSAATAEATNQVPSQQKLNQTLKKSMLEFASAVNSRDFTNFHQGIAKLWQSQITKEELYNAFKTFSDQEIDLTVLQDIEPVFSNKPHINESELLVLKGYYPSQPSVVYFELLYLYEHPEWKLASIDLQLK